MALPTLDSDNKDSKKKALESIVGLKLIAKNFMSLPSMARDLNVARQQIQKLVELQGGTPTEKADAQFKKADLLEQKLEVERAALQEDKTPTVIRKKKKGVPSGILGGLMKGLNFLKTLAMIGVPALAVINSLRDSIKEKLIESLKTFFNGVVEAIKETFSNLYDGIKEKMSEFTENLSEWFVETYENIKVKVMEFGEKVAEFAKDMFGRIGNWFSEKFQMIGSIFSNAVQYVQGIFTKITDFVTEKFNAFKNTLQSIADSAADVPLKIAVKSGLMTQEEADSIRAEREFNKKQRAVEAAEKKVRDKKIKNELNRRNGQRIYNKQFEIEKENIIKNRRIGRKKREWLEKKNLELKKKLLNKKGDEYSSRGRIAGEIAGYNYWLERQDAYDEIRSKSAEVILPPKEEVVESKVVREEKVKAQKEAPPKTSPSSGDKWIKNMVKKHEGSVPYPYKDTKGFWTIGVGHLMNPGAKKTLPKGFEAYADNKGPYDKSNNRTPALSQAEVDALLDKDYAHHKELAVKAPGYNLLNNLGKGAFVDLTFNMGKWWSIFKNARKAFESGDIRTGIKELVNSGWFEQVKGRARTVVGLLATNIENQQDELSRIYSEVDRETDRNISQNTLANNQALVDVVKTAYKDNSQTVIVDASSKNMTVVNSYQKKLNKQKDSGKLMAQRESA